MPDGLQAAEGAGGKTVARLADPGVKDTDLG
jgi:hypothetical protein